MLMFRLEGINIFPINTVCNKAIALHSSAEACTSPNSIFTLLNNFDKYYWGHCSVDWGKNLLKCYEIITVSQHFRYLMKNENYQQWKKESCQGIGSWTEVRYCAESMINSTLLTLQLLNSLSTIHLNWYFLRMTQPWMLYSQIKNSYFSFGWIWLLLGRQRSIGDVIWSFGG